jgi:nucleoside-diphosphate-sugar epimerase
MPKETAPGLSPLQRKVAQADYPPVPKRCVVTGGTGFVGIRVVEMLVERGAEKVISFDIVPKERIPPVVQPWNHPKIEWVVGDITDYDALSKVIKGADCVWHIAAAVGPFHPKKIYRKVNYEGTLNVIRACKEHGVKKLVFSSSPSTRFQGSLFSRPNIDGLTEADMSTLPQKQYMQMYAETKAMGELAVTAAVDDNFLAVSVAPHQVYGPRDNLFMPNVMEAAGSGRLRIFGPGTNRICFSHVDNYAHALIIAERKLYPGSPVLGKFYITTDGDTHPEPKAYCIFWKEIEVACRGLGFASIEKKAHLPFWFIYIVALFAEVIGWLSGTVFKLNVFNVFVLTMNRWFDISAAEKDLEFKPIIGFREGWADTIEWFKQYWLPDFRAAQANTKGFLASLLGIAARSQSKIDIQAKSTLKK